MNPLNSPLEVGLRVLVLLSASFPDGLDAAELVYLDHAMLHSGDVGGPSSLHPNLPAGPGELGMRRQLVDQGLLVLIRAGFAKMTPTVGGFVYVATEEAAGFLDILEASYVGQLRERAAWLFSDLAHRELDVRGGMNAITQRWTEAFAVNTHNIGEGEAG